MTAIRVNYAERKIVLSSAFAKKAFTHGTDEYRQLQAVRTSKTVPMLLWNDALREAEPPHLAEPLRQIVHVP